MQPFVCEFSAIFEWLASFVGHTDPFEGRYEGHAFYWIAPLLTLNPPLRRSFQLSEQPGPLCGHPVQSVALSGFPFFAREQDIFSSQFFFCSLLALRSRGPLLLLAFLY